MILETERLALREMTQADLPSLGKMLRDDEVMYAYEGAFSPAETQRWLEKQMNNYRQHGFGLWAVVLKKENTMIGQCGLTYQDFNGTEVLEVGYLFQKAFWHQGYATEAAAACGDYAFTRLHADRVYSIIRDTNLPSQRVAKRNGMVCVGGFEKHYRGVDMPHLVFCAQRTERAPGASNSADSE